MQPRAGKLDPARELVASSSVPPYDRLARRQSADLIESIHTPYGLALVTGPTGSGKSTTLYACLNLLNEPRHNICTVEDPVEYKFKGMNQVQIKVQVGLTLPKKCLLEVRLILPV